MIKKIGIYYRLSSKDYHCDEAMGSTTIKSISVSPANLCFKRSRGASRHVLARRYMLLSLSMNCSPVILSLGQRLPAGHAKAYQALRENTEAEKIIIGQEVATLNRMIALSRLNDDFNDYLAVQGHSEVSMFATCPVKCRFDRLSDRHAYSLDIKSCRDAIQHGFSQAYGQYHYHVQAPFYLYLLKLVTDREVNQFAFFAIENNSPSKNGLYYLGEDSLALGRQLMLAALQKLVDYQQNPTLKSEGLVLPSGEINVPSYLFDESFNDEISF